MPLELLLLGAITLLAIGLRFSTLGTQSFWYDEALTVGDLKSSFGGMLSHVPNTDALPPLYFVLAWPWTRLFGFSEVGVRSLSALAGSATVPVAYAAARALVGRGVAMTVALITAVSPALVWYSQEARPYALLTLLCAASLLFFARARRQPARREFIGWGVLSALALTAHYFAVFIVVPEALLLLRDRPSRRPTAFATAGIALVAAALAPLALYERTHASVAWIAGTSFYGRLHGLPYFFINNSDHGRAAEGLLLVIAAGVVVIGVVAFRRHRLQLTAGAWASLFIGLVALALPLVGKPLGLDYFLNRNLLPAWLPLVIFIAAVFAGRVVRPLALALLIAVCAVSLVNDLRVTNAPALQRDDWRAVAHALGTPRRARLIVISPFWQGKTLVIYRPTLHVGNAAVSRIDTVTFNGRVPFNMRPKNVIPPPPFRQVSAATVQNRFTLIEYTAPAPRRLSIWSVYRSGPNGAWPFVDSAGR